MDFQVGDAQSLPFANGQFDAGAMALVITFVPDPNKAVAELKRVTKPGGVLGTYMWDFFNKGFPQHLLREALERMGVGAVPTRTRPFPNGKHGRVFQVRGISRRCDTRDRSRCDLRDFRRLLVRANRTRQLHRAAYSQNAGGDVERLKTDLRTSLPKDKSGGIAYKARANAVRGRVPG